MIFRLVSVGKTSSTTFCPQFWLHAQSTDWYCFLFSLFWHQCRFHDNTPMSSAPLVTVVFSKQTNSTCIFLLFRREFVSKMNFEQPPPYPGNGPTAPGYPGQGPPQQGYPPQGYPPQGYPVNMEQPNAAYPNYPAGQMGPGGPYPGPGQPAYGYPGQPQPQFGWQGGAPPGPMYGEAPKNTGEWQQATETSANGKQKTRRARNIRLRCYLSTRQAAHWAWFYYYERSYFQKAHFSSYWFLKWLHSLLSHWRLAAASSLCDISSAGRSKRSCAGNVW